MLIETYPKAKFASWSAIPLQQVHDGSQLAFGAPYETRIDLSKAAVVLSLDADLLAALPGTLRQMKDWAAKRDPSARPGRHLSAPPRPRSPNRPRRDPRYRPAVSSPSRR